MNINLTRYSTDTVLPAMVRAIKVLPNLQTLHITNVTNDMSTSIKTFFEGNTFPQIRTVILPSEAHHVLRCCTEVRKVVSLNWDNSSRIVGAIRSSCKKVEVMEGLLGEASVMKREFRSSKVSAKPR